MKKVYSETISNIRMTGYFSSKTEVDSMKFEKTCYTVENGKPKAHRLELFFKKSDKEDILYNIVMSVSSDSYKKKTFNVFDVPKYKTFEYIDTKDMQKKERNFLKKSHILK